MVDFEFSLKFLTAIFLAWWCNKEISSFASRINKQIYSEYHSLVPSKVSYTEFEKESILNVKESKYTFLFYFFFPIIIINNPPTLAVVLIILCFLSVIDVFYYLTDVKYIVIIFLITLYNGSLETFYISVFFFIAIHLFSHFLLKKEGVGLGDSLLLIGLSPLFSVEDMLMLILMASVLGIVYYLIEPIFIRRKRVKLPFIPFISVATFIIINLV